MVGGKPLAVLDAAVSAGGAGASGLAPLIYSHGPGAFGQWATNSMQSASVWGAMAAAAPMAATTPATVHQLAGYLVQGALAV